MKSNLYLITMILCCSIIISCNNKKDVAPQGFENSNHKTEIVTKTYSVRAQNDEQIKDKVTMIQSIIKDKSGKEEANIYYNLDGSVDWKDICRYDDDGLKIGSDYFEGDEVQKSYYEYDLDSLGRKIGFRALDFNTDTLLYDGMSKFENSGKTRKDGYLNNNGLFKWNFEYLFDDNGKELGYVYIDLSSGARYPSTYEYISANEYGEWVERRIIENGKIQSIEIREFRKAE